MASVAFEGVRKRFPDGTLAVESLDLAIDDCSFAVLVGPSGCGKSTALRLVAGLEQATEGHVLIDGQPVDAVPPGGRDVAMVFQNYALYPHMSVADNIAFGLRAHGVPRQERRRRAVEIAHVLGLEDLLTRKPKALSGGQRQRVAMGRAIAREPRVFLMDEPLSNLDAQLRVQMRGEIVRIQREVGITALYVTHDQVEAMTMGTKVAVMNAGRLMQFDAPKTLYDAPANAFVARFIGNPPMNILRGELHQTETGPAFWIGEQRARLPGSVLGLPELRERLGAQVLLGVRAEDVGLAGTRGDDAVRLRCTVLLTEVLGSEVIVHLEVSTGPSDPATGTRLAGKLPEGAFPRVGDSIEVDLLASRLHFFDAATEDALGTTGAGRAGAAVA
jgi:multiple sugar transport system ATP-binding protein